LGSHRLICGDSASPDILKRILAETKAILMLTDPPYGINMDKGFSGSGGFSGKGKKIPRRKYSDNWDEDRPTKETFKILIEQCDLNIIFGGNFFSDILPRSTHWLVWDKKNTMPTFGDCELAWTNIERKSVKKYEILWNGLLGKEKERFHPTQKPLKLFQEILKDYTKENDNIFDPFLGSGTTLIAAEMLKRNCIGIELSRAYCDVIIKRYINYCAKQGFNAIIKRNGEIISHEGFI
jgi:DNA modification methylase